ncbi:helix-turn-helix domain-containing protein [Pseudonocardia lacus]|uniref:helix-turn-helix domain-containing protein n=1 Tax=Pseudonocardia lacus TaxID=2835865 RepID=UPI001BDD1C79|nr:helix-turn-helix domain-containing protein [Pseudonocardia lacus]
MAEDQPKHPRPGVEYLKSGEVAKLLGISQTSFNRMVASGLIRPTWTTPAGGHGRYLWEDVERQVAEIRRKRGERP